MTNYCTVSLRIIGLVTPPWNPSPQHRYNQLAGMSDGLLLLEYDLKIQVYEDLRYKCMRT